MGQSAELVDQLVANGSGTATDEALPARSIGNISRDLRIRLRKHRHTERVGEERFANGYGGSLGESDGYDVSFDPQLLESLDTFLFALLAIVLLGAAFLLRTTLLRANP